MSNTREKLIKLIEESGMLDNQSRCSIVADELIANGVTVLQWIPVTERVPEGEDLVMIFCKNGAMFVGYLGKQYADFERRWGIKTALNSTKLLNLGRVTHWMPLPIPPEAGK